MDDEPVVEWTSFAITSALDSSSANHENGVSYLRKLKAGNPDVLATTSLDLASSPVWPPEIRLYAFNLLKHLARRRWVELNPESKARYITTLNELMVDFAHEDEEWELKNALVAVIVELLRVEGGVPSNYLEYLKCGIANSKDKRSRIVYADMACLIMQSLPGDVTAYNEGELPGLNGSISLILKFLHEMLQNPEGAESHNIVNHLSVSAMNAFNAYAEWTCLFFLEDIINSCGALLSNPHIRIHACKFLKLVSSRKRPANAESGYVSIMSSIFVKLMDESTLNTSKGLCMITDSDVVFEECVCESLVSLGSTHLQCITTYREILHKYLQKMMQYFKHYKPEFHHQALTFWLAFANEFMKPKVSADNVIPSCHIDSFSDICSEMLEISFLKLLKKEKVNLGNEHSAMASDLYDDLESRENFVRYRSKLLELIRLVASSQPLIAITVIEQRVCEIINILPVFPLSPQISATLESMELVMEDVLTAVTYNWSASYQEIVVARKILDSLLALNWTKPELIGIFGHYLEALGPLLKWFPDYATKVIEKLFELLNSLLTVIKDPSSSVARNARLHICSAFVRLAETASTNMLPHIEEIMTRALHNKEKLLPRELIFFRESSIIVALEVSPELLPITLTEALKDVLCKLSELQQYQLPDAVINICGNTELMWSLFHTFTFFENVLQRLVGKSIPISTLHPLAPYLRSMLQFQLKLLRAIHFLWFQSVTKPEVKAVIVMSDDERISLLQETNSEKIKCDRTFFEDLKDQSSNEIDTRNWLKDIRERGYNVLGLSSELGEIFFEDTGIITDLKVLLSENLESMEYRHIRQLVQSVLIPVAKNCPFQSWLLDLLLPLLSHVGETLRCSWDCFLTKEGTNVPDIVQMLDGTEMKAELEEKLLVTLTREVYSLLDVLSSFIDRLPLEKDIDVLLKLYVDAFGWTDGESVVKALTLCQTVVGLATSGNRPNLRKFVCKDLFYAMIKGLALESNAFARAALVSLCHEIFVTYYMEDSALGQLRQALFSFPHIRFQDVIDFEVALKNDSGSSEDIMKRLLCPVKTSRKPR